MHHLLTVIALALVLCFSGLCTAQGAVLIKDIEDARNSGDLDTADSLANDLLAQAELSSEPNSHADALYQLARNAMERNDYAAAHHYLNDALPLYQSSNNDLGLAKTYRQIGRTYRYQSNYSVSLEYLYMALAIYQEKGSARDLASVNNSLGIVLEKLGQFAEAADFHQLALQANYELRDQSGIASALYNLGDIRRTMGDLEIALDYFRQSLEMDIAGGNKRDIAYSHYKVGYTSMQLGDLAAAEQHMTEAHQLFTDIGAKRDIDWALSGLAELAYRKGELLKASGIIEGVIARAEENQYNSLLLDAVYIAAQVAIAEEQFDYADMMLEKGIPLSQQINESHMLSQLLALKVAIAEQQQDLAAAYAALKHQHELENQVFNQKRLDAIASTQAQTEFIRRTNQLELLEKERDLEQLQTKADKEQRWFFTLAGFCVLVIVFMTYHRLIQQRHTRVLEAQVTARTRELELANKELSTLSITDRLTGLHNRRYLERLLNNGLLTDSQKTKLAFFIIDLDNFKRINDTYGHVAGDLVLQQAAERLRRVFKQDYLVRWGGEEFVALVKNIEHPVAMQLARRINREMHNTPFTLVDDAKITMSCSVGFVSLPFPAMAGNVDATTLFAMADSCLYAAKSDGRNKAIGVTNVSAIDCLPLPSSRCALQQLNDEHVITLSVCEHDTLSNKVVKLSG